jgi:hypothetical protein
MLVSSAITEPKQDFINVLNIAVFGKNLCTVGNILPFSTNSFPIISPRRTDYVEKPSKIELSGLDGGCRPGSTSSYRSMELNPVIGTKFRKQRTYPQLFATGLPKGVV